MSRTTTGMAVLALLLAAGLCTTGHAGAAVAVEAQNGNADAAPAREPFNPADAARDDDPKVERPKADEPKKEEPKVRVDSKAALARNALAAIAAAEKAVTEGNKDAATAEMAKAKAALEALRKAILRDELRENMEFRSLGGEGNVPAGDARAPERRTRVDGDANAP